MAVDVGALVDYANELEETTPDSGLAWLKARRDEATATINGKGAFTIISTTIDGQTFSGSISASALDMFSAFQQAIRRFNGTDIRMTYPTFSPQL
jgi:hypothetical protein